MARSGAGDGREPAAPRNLAEVCYRAAEERPGAEVAARRTGDGWEPVSAARMLGDVTAVAKGLIGAGVGAGDRVVVAADARYEHLVVHYAVWAVRAVLVALPDTCAEARFLHVLRDCRPAAVVLQDGRRAAAAARAARELPDLGRVVRLDGPDGTDALTRPGAYMEPSAVRQRLEETTPADPAVLCYPISTDVRPRGAVLGHGNRIAAASAAARRFAPALDAAARSAGALVRAPLADAFGQAAVAACLQAQVRVALADPRTPLVEEARALKPAAIVTGAGSLAALYRSEERRAYSGGWETNSSFGAAVHLATEYDRTGRRGAWKRVSMAMYDSAYARFRDGLGGRVQLLVATGGPTAELDHFYNGAGIPLVRVFGVPESGGAATASAPGDRRAGTEGRALDGTEVALSQGGEVLVRGPGVFAGYWNDPDASRSAFAGGWLATGHEGVLDDEGRLEVTGRIRPQACTGPVRVAAPQPPPAHPAAPGLPQQSAPRQSRPQSTGGPNPPARHDRPQAPPPAERRPSADELVAGLEARIRSHPLISQVAVVGRGRPYCTALITLAAEQLEHWRLVRSRPLSHTPAEIAADPEVQREIEHAVGEANVSMPAPLAVRAFHVLPEEFTVQSGLLLPDGTVRRDAVLRAFADEIEGLYSAARPASDAGLKHP
ncbi:AMP-binding protein [Nocardiopsis coralliicola]